MKEHDICTVSKRIRERRKQLGMTQAALADRLDVNTKTIVTIEKMSVPTFATDRFIDLCTILDCSPDYLMGIDDLPHRETSDIHALTGLSADAIEVQMQRVSNRQVIHYTDNGLINEFISHLITDVNFDIVVRHIRSLAWAQIHQDDAERFNKMLVDQSERLESAVKNKTDSDKKYADNLYKASAALIENYSNSQNEADASAWKFSQMASKVLDDFSEIIKPIVQEQLYKEFFGSKEKHIADFEREVLGDEERL